MMCAGASSNWKRLRVDKACQLAATILEDRCAAHAHDSIITQHNIVRVRLFKNAKEIANDQKEKRLKREYKRMVELSQLIFWTDKGREGAAHIRQKMQQKSIAEEMAATAGSGMTVKEAQKIVAESLEVQKKANAVRSAAFASSTSHGSTSQRKRSRQRYGHDRGDDRRRSSNNRYRGGGTSGSSRGRAAHNSRQTGRGYPNKSRKAKPGGRA